MLVSNLIIMLRMYVVYNTSDKAAFFMAVFMNAIALRGSINELHSI